MKIDRTLKLVLDRKREEDGAPYHVFASSLSRGALRAHWQVVQKAIGWLYSEGGGGAATAPRFAAEAIRSAARALNVEKEVELNFLGEIRRLANVVMPAANGWETMTFEEAAQKHLSEDEADEILNAIAYFTLALSFHSTEDRAAVVAGAALLWNGRTTSSPFTEFLASLPTSTQAENSGATTTAASPQGPGVRTLTGQSVPS